MVDAQANINPTNAQHPAMIQYLLSTPTAKRKVAAEEKPITDIAF